jgi:hypothetical protein
VDIPFEWRFVLAALATWRLAHLFSLEDGPFDLVLKLRERAGTGFVGQLMDCFYCLSLWLAAPLALYVSLEPLHWLMCWWGCAGAAGLLHQATYREEPTP